MYQRKKQGVTKRNGYTLIDKEKEGIKDMTIKETYHWIWENTNLMQDTMMSDFECLAYCVKHGILKEINAEHFAAVSPD